MTRVLPLLMLQLATASMQPSRISPGLGLSNRKVLEQSYYYKSPGGVVYGPFSGEQIDAWWHQGFFPQCLPISINPGGPFVALEEIIHQDLPAMPESMNSDEFYVYDRSLVSSPFSAFKSRSSRLLSKLNKVKLREIVSNKMSGIRVNPVVSFYLRPHKGSLINTIWMPLLADATLYGLSLFLVGRVAYVLLGLIARVFFDGSLSRQGLLTSGMCSVKIVPYSDISLDMRYSLSDVFKSTLSRFSSMPYQLSSVLAVLAVISLLLRPRLQSACKHAASEWHYHQQLNMPWKGDWLSRLDFSEEGHHSVALIQAVYVLLMSLFAVPFMASANAATSLFYLMSIGSILWQLLSVVLLSTGTAQAKSLENIDNGQNSTIKKLSLQVQSLENFLVNDDERTIYRWPSLLENIKMTRNRALGSLSRATKYVGSAHDRPLVLLAQILLTITALTKSFTLNDFVSEFGINNIPSFAQKSSLVAFSGIGFTHLTAINAESLFTIVDIVHRFSISIFIPICLCWQAVSSSTSGIHHVRRLNLLWLSRMPKQSPTPLVHPGLLAESPGTDNDRWATDGPLKQDGIEIDHVTAVGSGRVLLRDISLRIPSGQLTVLIGPRSAGPEMNYLLDLLWNGHDTEISGIDVAIQRGSISVHGRDVRDWKLLTLRDKIIYLKDHEEHLPMNLGLLCGLGSDNTLDGIDRQRRAIELSGVAEIEKKFPNGFKTDMGMVSKSSLTADQWRKVHLCRALCRWDKDIIFMQAPTHHMNEIEEKRFLEGIRSMIRPDQIVLVTSVRHGSARYADHALLFEKGSGVRVLDSGQQKALEPIA